MGVPVHHVYNLSPSDLTYLYDSCKRCFAIKVKYNIGQPSIPLPTIFSKIAALQKESYSGKRTETFCPQLPPGEVKYGEKKVQSEVIHFDGLKSGCQLVGRFDVVIEFDDKARDGYGVVDFKTADPNDKRNEIYARQLLAYAYALEHPAPNALSLKPVTRLGLLYFVPGEFVPAGGEMRGSLSGKIVWTEIAKDESSFLAFLEEVVALLDGDLPAPNPDCAWCQYLTKVEEKGLFIAADKRNAGTLGNPAPSCPKCGGPMVLKHGKRGQFWGCMKFPDCRGTRDITVLDQ